MRRTSSKKETDAQLREFERKDLGDDVARSKSAVVIRPKTRQMPTSIFLNPMIIAKLKKKGEHRGIGYQTMLKIIVHEHVDEY